MKTVVEKLREHSEPDTSNWREVFKEMNANDIWLKHSQHIALIMLDKMDELKMTQKQLAERMSWQSPICVEGPERAGKPFA